MGEKLAEVCLGRGVFFSSCARSACSGSGLADAEEEFRHHCGYKKYNGSLGVEFRLTLTVALALVAMRLPRDICQDIAIALSRWWQSSATSRCSRHSLAREPENLESRVELQAAQK